MTTLNDVMDLYAVVSLVDSAAAHGTWEKDASLEELGELVGVGRRGL